MTKHPIEVITSVERRRRWSREEKEGLVAACLQPDAVISEIARAAGIHVSQLFRRHKELCRIEEPQTETGTVLVPMIVSEAASTVPPVQPDRAASMATLIMTAKLNDIDPQVWLADVLARIADTPMTRLKQLLPWNWTSPAANAEAA